MGRLLRLRTDDRAATAVEYGLILALIVLAMLASLRAVAGGIINKWNTVDTTVTSSST
jgi:pilus assembly protein Flp/PilA